MAVIRITEPMADTILAAVKREGGVYVVRGRVQTENALMDRGLVEFREDYAFLTPAGQWVLGYLQTGATRRAWTVDEIHSKSAVLHNETPRAPKLTAADLPEGTRVQHADGRTGTAKGCWTGRVTDPSHENFGREFTGVEWDATDRRPWPEAARPFVDELTIVSLPDLPGPKAVGDVMAPPTEAFEKAAPTLEDIELDSDEADRAQARREEASQPTGNANVREVSKTLKAAGFTTYNPERGGCRSGYKASQDGSRVLVRWRQGADTDLLGVAEREATRTALTDAYEAALKAAGYPVVHRSSGLYVVGSKNRAKPGLEDVELDSDEAAREDARREESTVECESVTREGMSVHACYLLSGHERDHTNGIKTWPVKAETPTVTEYSVKIWYRSGAYEGVPHSPEDLARKIYADAVNSDGVEFAELHGPSGRLIESKTTTEEN